YQLLGMQHALPPFALLERTGNVRECSLCPWKAGFTRSGAGDARQSPLTYGFMLGSAEWAARGLSALLSLVLMATSCAPAATDHPMVAAAPTPPPDAIEDAPKSKWESCYSSFTPAGSAE